MNANSMQRRNRIGRSELHSFISVKHHHAIANPRHDDATFIFAREWKFPRCNHLCKSIEHIEIGAFKNSVLTGNVLVRVFGEYCNRASAKLNRNAGFTNEIFGSTRRNFAFGDLAGCEGFAHKWTFGRCDDATNPVVCKKRLACGRPNLSENNH